MKSSIKSYTVVGWLLVCMQMDVVGMNVTGRQPGCEKSHYAPLLGRFLAALGTKPR